MDVDMKTSDILAKLKKISLQKNENRPINSFTRREICTALDKKAVNGLIFDLIAAGELEFAGKMSILDVVGQQHKVPTYRFIEKKKKK